MRELTDAELTQAYSDAFGWGLGAAGIADLRARAAAQGWDALRDWFMTYPQQQFGRPGLPAGYFDYAMNISMSGQDTGLSYVPAIQLGLSPRPPIINTSVPLGVGIPGLNSPSPISASASGVSLPTLALIAVALYFLAKS